MTISLNKLTCPHCNIVNASFICVSMFRQPISENGGIVFSCSSCDKSLIVDLDVAATMYFVQQTNSEKSEALSIRDNMLCISTGMQIGICSYYPKPIEISIPEHLSDIVSKNLREAKELLRLKFFNPSAMASRRTIDLATKELLPDSKEMLYGRIEKLKKDGLLIQSLYDWADIVRLGGNSANHDYDNYTEEDATQLLDFVEMFLLYTFTFPNMVEIKKPKDNRIEKP